MHEPLTPLTLSVIVPATDDPPTLSRCEAAIRASEHPPEEVIVVGEPRASGPAAARNTGARSARGDILVFVDADVAIHGDALGRIKDHFERDATLAGVFGSYDDSPEGGVVSAFRNLLHHHVHQASAGYAETFWAGLGALRRDVFLRSGGFDERRYRAPSIEDIELGLRLTDAGARLLLDPEIQGSHLKRWTTRSMVRSDLLARGMPWTTLLLERRRGSRQLNLGWNHRASAIASVAAVVLLLRRRMRAAVVLIAALVALNRRFYALLLRRRGPRAAAVGPMLHVVHHVTGAIAAATALIRYLSRRAGGR